MKHSLEHLPSEKQRDLGYVVQVIREEFDQITGFANGKRKQSHIIAIILFGSHARGDWVQDEVNGYISDYDILVVLDREELVEEYEIWNRAEDRVQLKVDTPLSLIVHSLKDINDQLSQGSYFFRDIKQDGIAIYDKGTDRLKEPGNLTAEEAKVIAQKHFDQWFESANTFHKYAVKARTNRDDKYSAFNFHQASEQYFATLLLVFTNYRPKTHNLKRLCDLAIELDVRITEIFPQDTKFHRRCFQLLKRAYVEARYSEHYRITEEELTWLSMRVAQLQELTDTLCQGKIAQL